MGTTARAYSGAVTDRPRNSALRDAFVGILMTVGPFFGVRYRPPRVEIPVVTTPATENDDDPPGTTTSAQATQHTGSQHADEDGIVI